MNYVTTNIRLPEDDYLRLKEEAAKKRKSFSAIVREKVGKKRTDRNEYGKLLLSLKTDWFNPKEIEQNRKQIEEQLQKRGWAGK